MAPALLATWSRNVARRYCVALARERARASPGVLPTFRPPITVFGSSLPPSHPSGSAAFTLKRNEAGRCTATLGSPGKGGGAEERGFSSRKAGGREMRFSPCSPSRRRPRRTSCGCPVLITEDRIGRNSPAAARGRAAAGSFLSEPGEGRAEKQGGERLAEQSGGRSKGKMSQVTKLVPEHGKC